MKQFTSLEKTVSWLQDTHYLFGGVPWQDEWYDIIRNTIKNPAIGATWEAWIDVPNEADRFGLRTYIYIEKNGRLWDVYEATTYEGLLPIMDRDRS